LALAYLWLADVVVAVHAAYAAFVLGGFVAILLGWIVPWAWIRNFTFRICHLFCTALVAVEAFCGVTCPLTALENLLLQKGGRPVDQRSFIGR
jgi:polyferredoxin